MPPLPIEPGLSGVHGLKIPEWNLGVTAGYRADEVRSGETSVMIVRWHNVGTTTIGKAADQLLALGNTGDATPKLANLIPSAPATIYYDVPAGEYSLTDDATNHPRDGEGAVFSKDWNVAADPPALKFPPTLPDLQNPPDVTSLTQLLGVLVPGLGGLPLPPGTGTGTPPLPGDLGDLGNLGELGGLDGLGDLANLLNGGLPLPMP